MEKLDGYVICISMYIFICLVRLVIKKIDVMKIFRKWNVWFNFNERTRLEDQKAMNDNP